MPILAAHHKCGISAEHIRGVLNEMADALSRDLLSTFQALQPAASKTPTLIPSQLQIGNKLDWLSTNWTHHFNGICHSQ